MNQHTFTIQGKKYIFDEWLLVCIIRTMNDYGYGFALPLCSKLFNLDEAISRRLLRRLDDAKITFNSVLKVSSITFKDLK